MMAVYSHVRRKALKLPKHWSPRRRRCKYRRLIRLQKQQKQRFKMREEELCQLFEDVVRRVQIPAEVADWIAEALRESQDDKERFHRSAVMRLQQSISPFSPSWTERMKTD